MCRTCDGIRTLMTLSATLDGQSSPRPQGRLVRMDLQWLIDQSQAQLPFQDGRREVPHATSQGANTDGGAETFAAFVSLCQTLGQRGIAPIAGWTALFRSGQLPFASPDSR